MQNVADTVDLRGQKQVGLAAMPRLCNTTDEQLLANIERNARRGLPEFQASIVHNNGEIVIVGSGPSVSEHIDDIRAERSEHGRPIVAVKGAHDWLIERGIVPDLCVMIDAQPERVSCVQRKCKDVGYLLASQVAPETFDWLSGMDVILFHAWAGIGEDEILGPDRLKIGGGTTSGLRTMAASYLMGFRKMILYGFDSCLRGNVKRVNGDIAENLMQIFVGPEGEHRREFTCNGAMASQASEFQENFRMLPGLRVRVVGGGLLDAILAERARIGHVNERF